jgi:hypothetical protein
LMLKYKPDFTPQGKFYRSPWGDKLPSVSTVLAAIDELEKGPPYGLIKWREAEVAAGRDPGEAAVRGTKVHTFAEEYSMGFAPVVDEAVEPWIKQLKPALDKLYKELGGVTHREQFCRGSWYAGQFDQATFRLDGPSTIIDFKTIGKPTPETHPADLADRLVKYRKKVDAFRSGSHESAIKAFRQLRGYAAAWGEENAIKHFNLIVVGITPDECFLLRQSTTTKKAIKEWDAYKPLYYEALERRKTREAERLQKTKETALAEALRIHEMGDFT